MAAINFVFRDVVDDHTLASLANFVADRSFDLQFTARLETKIDLVEHRTRDPAPSVTRATAAKPMPVA